MTELNDVLAWMIIALGALAVVVVLLFTWGKPLQGVIVAFTLAIQLLLMARMLRNPRGTAPIYNATGTTFYVLGMLTAACAVPLAFPPLP